MWYCGITLLWGLGGIGLFVCLVLFWVGFGVLTLLLVGLEDGVVGGLFVVFCLIVCVCLDWF